MVISVGLGADEALADSAARKTIYFLALGALSLTLLLLAGVISRSVKKQQALQGALKRSEERHALAMHAAHDGMWDHDMETGKLQFSSRWHAHLGYEPGELGDDRSAFWGRLHRADRARLRAALIAHIKRREPFNVEVRVRTKAGENRTMNVHGQAVWNEHGRATRMAGVLSDITERRAMQDALFEEKERAEVTLNSIADAVITTDTAGKISYMNPIAQRMTGWTPRDAAGKPLDEVFRLINASTREAAPNPVAAVFQSDAASEPMSDCVLLRRDETEVAIEVSAAPIHERTGKIVGAVLVFHDVTEARIMAAHMTHIAQHDFLTGLPNRLLLDDRLAQAIAHAKRNRTGAALLFMDLDRFKPINDAHGHAVGDAVLQQVAQRLRVVMRKSDTVCRQGGDEFIVLLAEIESADAAQQVAQKILDAVSQPYEVDGLSVSLSASIGCSTYPADGADVATLTRSADIAMYHAKESGRNNVQVFTTALGSSSAHRAELENRLRHAFANDELSLHYQPKMNLVSGEITGAEALLRWHHPEHGAIPPQQFIPVAEEAGLIGEIGTWVLQQACKQSRAWQLAGLPALPVAVNVAALQLHDPAFADIVQQTLHDTGLAAALLELTESVLMDDAGATINVLQRFRAMGVRISVDDFGTGYSSLSYLQRFPIDTIKIDRSFVSDISTKPDDAAIITAIISMARALDRNVIAEGVETTEQLEFLRALGCDEMQGFYLCAPVSAADFGHFLRKRKATRPEMADTAL
jgi:diguanylate cyclase (GGDEF)-like protein/PAS domain S-box-containing protein